MLILKVQVYLGEFAQDKVTSLSLFSNFLPSSCSFRSPPEHFISLTTINCYEDLFTNWLLIQWPSPLSSFHMFTSHINTMGEDFLLFICCPHKNPIFLFSLLFALSLALSLECIHKCGKTQKGITGAGAWNWQKITRKIIQQQQRMSFLYFLKTLGLKITVNYNLNIFFDIYWNLAIFYSF